MSHSQSFAPDRIPFLNSVLDNFIAFCLKQACALSFALVTFTLTGCVSKSVAQAEARAAYLAGQRDAIAQLNQGQAPSPSPAISNVTIIGPVENPVVPWREGLTLSQTILQGVYVSPVDPVMIVIRRKLGEHQIQPSALLNGADFPVQPGDIIEFQLPAE